MCTHVNTVLLCLPSIMDVMILFASYNQPMKNFSKNLMQIFFFFPKKRVIYNVIEQVTRIRKYIYVRVPEMFCSNSYKCFRLLPVGIMVKDYFL